MNIDDFKNRLTSIEEQYEEEIDDWLESYVLPEALIVNSEGNASMTLQGNALPANVPNIVLEKVLTSKGFCVRKFEFDNLYSLVLDWS